MKIPTIPQIPSIMRRPTEYAAFLAFVAVGIANELGAGISTALGGLIVAATAALTTGAVELFYRDTIGVSYDTEHYQHDNVTRGPVNPDD